MGILLISLSFCQNLSKTNSFLIIPLKTGLAKNNGATPWYAEISIGNPPNEQLFKLIMDTGTGSTWVTSDECETVPCKHHRKFDADLSTSHIWIDTLERSSELGAWGSFTFKVGQDTWNFNAFNSESKRNQQLYRVPEMRFLQATGLIDGKKPDGSFNTNWDDLVQDGSLAFPAESLGNPSTQILDLLIREKLITKKIVSYHTNPNLNKGEVILGGLDRSKFEAGTLKYFPLVRGIAGQDHSGSLWTIELIEIIVGGKSVKLPDTVVFALDTGSSRFKGDPVIINNIVDLITEKGRKANAVNTQSELMAYPNITFVLKDEHDKLVRYTLSAEHYFQQFPDSLQLAFHELFPDKNSSTKNILLAGSIFLDNYFTVFDYTTSPARVGIARKSE